MEDELGGKGAPIKRELDDYADGDWIRCSPSQCGKASRSRRWQTSANFDLLAGGNNTNRRIDKHTIRRSTQMCWPQLVDRSLTSQNPRSGCPFARSLAGQ